MMADVKIISWQDHLVIPPYKVLIKLSDSHFINLLGIDRLMPPLIFWKITMTIWAMVQSQLFSQFLPSRKIANNASPTTQKNLHEDLQFHH